MFDTSDELGMGQDAPTVQKGPALKPDNVYKGGRKSYVEANRVARFAQGKQNRDTEGKARGKYPLICVACVRMRSQHRI
jgi:hypothetical protein